MSLCTINVLYPELRNYSAIQGIIKRHLNRIQKFSWKEVLGGLIIALLFLGASFGSERFASTVHSIVGEGGTGGMLSYIMTVIVVVLIPFASTLPLVPVAVSLWGNIVAAVLTLLGWVISINIAFYIARHLGKPVLERIALFRHIERFGDMVPRKNFLLGVFFLGVIGAPIDLASYAFGLFTHVKQRFVVTAFALGFIPFAFFLTYTATLQLVYQAYIIGFMLIAWFVFYGYLKQPKNKNKENKIKRRQKILDFFDQNNKITNDDIEKLLNVSNASAFRYLEELEKDGLIRQIGKTGRSVYYKRV